MEHFHVALADVKQERKALLAASLLAVHPIQGRRRGRLFVAERRAFSPRDPLIKRRLLGSALLSNQHEAKGARFLLQNKNRIVLLVHLQGFEPGTH